MKHTHKLLFGFGTVTTVLAPIAVVVACGSNNDKNTEEVYTPVVTQSRTLDEIKGAVWDDTSKTLDITKVKNTFELGILLSDLTGFNNLKGLIDDFKWSNDSNNKPVLSEVEIAYNRLLARFKKVANDFDFHIKDTKQTKDFSIKVKDLGQKLIDGIKVGYVGDKNIPALSLMWGKSAVGEIIKQYDSMKNQMTITQFADAMVSQGPLGASLNVSGHEDEIKSSIESMLNGGQTMIDSIGQQMGDVTNISLVSSLATIIGLEPLMGVISLTELPLPAVGAFFEVLRGVSADLDLIANDPIITSSEVVKNFNPSNDSIKNRNLDKYDDSISNVKEVLLATFGYESIIA